MAVHKPFLKWIGGKTQIIDKIIEHVPANMDNYHELFLGGGSVLFAMLSLKKAGKITISGDIYAYDLNAKLINVYQQVQRDYRSVYDELAVYIDGFNSCNDKSKYYYDRRDEFNTVLNMTTLNTAKHAALFIFINKTCFRGLYRENAKGEFNAAYGHYVKPSFPSKSELRASSQLIQSVVFRCCDFEDSINEVGYGDYCYIDPPYAPESINSFVNYTNGGFTVDMHETLFTAIHEIHHTGAIFTLSNHKVDLVMNYFNNFKCVDCVARRAINIKNAGSKTTEIIITNGA